MEELVKPNFSGVYYRPSEVVRILNHNQANFYLSRGVPLMDIYVSREKTVYVFDKKKSFESYQLWNQRKRDLEDEVEETEVIADE